MKIHKLKCIDPYFRELVIGNKTFEVRYNDRDYKEGDILILEYYNPKTKEYENQTVVALITYVLDNEDYCKEGFVVLGIKKLHQNIAIPF